MHDTHPAGRLGLLTEPRRNRYFYGKLLDVAHLQMEQSYFNRKRWLLNRLSLGEGVLCGLDVESRDGQLCVTRGLAIDSLGREIIVPAKVCINPWKPTDDCGRAEPELSPDESYDAYLCLEYRECSADFMPVLATECDTRDQCAAGTTVESFRLSLHIIHEGDPESLPARPRAEICTALRGGKASDKIEELCNVLSSLVCEAPTETPCVTLARVKLNARVHKDADPTISDVKVCSVRPMAYSNAVLFDMILCLAARIDECCGLKPPVITKVWPGNGAVLTKEPEISRLGSDTGGLELTFDRAMDGAMLGNPDPWLGLWAVYTPARQPATALRLSLTPVGPVPMPPSADVKYALSSAAGGGAGAAMVHREVTHGMGGAGPAVGDVICLLVIRAAGTNITDTNTPGNLLDADFAGTGLDFDAVGLSPDVPTATLDDALWTMNPGDSRKFDEALFAKNILTPTPLALPASGSGDGTAGGLFHSAFKIIQS